MNDAVKLNDGMSTQAKTQLIRGRVRRTWKMVDGQNRERNFLLFGCRVLTILALGFIATVRSVADETTRSPSEALKEFVASPPPIRELRFEITHPTKWPLPPYQSFIARWQPNGLLVLEENTENTGSNATNGSSYLRATGSYEDSYWNFVGKNQTLITWNDRGDSAKDSHNGSYSANRTAVDFIAKVLNIGIPNLRVGAIRWDGDNFDADSDLSGAHQHGTLIRSPAGRAERLILKTTRGGKTSESEIVYSYSTDFALPFFPNRITVNLLQGGEKLLLEEIFVLQMEIGEAPLDRTLFMPDASVTNDVAWRYQQVSNSIYLETSRGLAKDQIIRPQQTRPYDKPASTVVICILLIMTLLPLAIFLFRRKKRSKT